MSWLDEEWRLYEDEIDRREMIAETLKNISEEGVRGYLGVHGDAVDFRVKDCIEQAKSLNQYSFPRQAIIASSTAIELIIRFMLIRPLIQAAFLTEDWAYLLTHRIATGRTDEDRELLPKLLEYHDVKIWEIKLSTGAELWPTITQTVLPKRHRIVHRGESAVLNEAKIAVECAVALREKVVLPLAKRHGFSLDATGCWNKIQKNGKSTHSYEARSPFDT